MVLDNYLYHLERNYLYHLVLVQLFVAPIKCFLTTEFTQPFFIHTKSFQARQLQSYLIHKRDKLCKLKRLGKTPQNSVSINLKIEESIRISIKH